MSATGGPIAIEKIYKVERVPRVLVYNGRCSPLYCIHENDLSRAF